MKLHWLSCCLFKHIELTKNQKQNALIQGCLQVFLYMKKVSCELL